MKNENIIYGYGVPCCLNSNVLSHDEISEKFIKTFLNRASREGTKTWPQPVCNRNRLSTQRKTYHRTNTLNNNHKITTPLKIQNYFGGNEIREEVGKERKNFSITHSVNGN